MSLFLTPKTMRRFTAKKKSSNKLQRRLLRGSSASFQDLQIRCQVGLLWGIPIAGCFMFMVENTDQMDELRWYPDFRKAPYRKMGKWKNYETCSVPSISFSAVESDRLLRGLLSNTPRVALALLA